MLMHENDCYLVKKIFKLYKYNHQYDLEIYILLLKNILTGYAITLVIKDICVLSFLQ